jgi:predicted PurR-regulated permease PerM
MNKLKPEELSYTQKVWHTVAIVAFVAIMVLIAQVTFNVLLLCLAGVLISVYFHGLGDLVQRKTHWRRGLCMTVSIVGSFLLLGALFWFMGNSIQQQIDLLSNSLPHTFVNVKLQLAQTPLGRKVLQANAGDNSGKLLATAQQFFSTSFGVLGNMYIILFLGIFFTASPSLYKNGLVLLVPKSGKPVAVTIMERTSTSLKGWLKGTMLNMVLIAIVLPIGLAIMGVPAALVLGLLTGILCIVPNFGSAVAMGLGVLLALTIGAQTAFIVAIIYIAVQTLVGNIISPIIQNKMINLPPALTLVSQLLMAILGGVMGIILAIPLLAIAMILVDELYVKKINADVVE